MAANWKDTAHTKLRTHYSNSLSLEDNLAHHFADTGVTNKTLLYEQYRAGGARLALADMRAAFWTAYVP